MASLTIGTTIGGHIAYHAGNFSSSATGVSTATPNTLVQRDANADFAARIITATNFVQSSDIKLKSNVREVSHDTSNIRIVDYQMKGQSATGVIAQEVEMVFPELVHETDHKAVDYISLMMRMINDLRSEIKTLEEEVHKLKNE